VDSFLKTMSVLEFDEDSLSPIHSQVEAFAEVEHLTAHANSIKVRFHEA
jgi:histidinol dehydrogenase